MIIKKAHVNSQEFFEKTIQNLSQENQQHIKNLEKKLDKYYISCKLEKLCFIGIGGGGCNIVEDISHIDPWHDFIHINSDLQALQNKTSKKKILLSFEKKEGLGCGGDAVCGTKLVDNASKKQLCQFTQEYKAVYIMVTLGGGVGSGATPEFIEYLKSLGKEVYVHVTMPFSFEGTTREDVANNALKNIKKVCSNVRVIKNDVLLKNNEGLGTRETFKLASELMYTQITNSFMQKKTDRKMSSDKAKLLL